MEDKILQDLHNAVAEDLLKKVLSGEATAAELSVARAFLKDNGIDATPGQSEPINDLIKNLPFDTEAA
tara:strand:- start:1034 stop:1237 length:204 start_codon:yes stop_codon:yes gene_type:complete